MSLFFSYLKQQLKYILLFLLFSITFAITFFFYNFPLEALTYPTLLCVCFWLFFFIWDFSKTKALHTRLMELSNLTELSVDMIRALPQSDSIENTDYQLLLSGLAEQILDLKTALLHGVGSSDQDTNLFHAPDASKRGFFASAQAFL